VFVTMNTLCANIITDILTLIMAIMLKIWFAELVVRGKRMKKKFTLSC